MVKTAKVGETRESRQREAEFRKLRGQQASLLKKVEASKAAQERRSEQLEEEAKKLEEEIKQVLMASTLNTIQTLARFLNLLANQLITTLARFSQRLTALLKRVLTLPVHSAVSFLKRLSIRQT